MTTLTDVRPGAVRRDIGSHDAVTLRLGGEYLAIPSSSLREVLELGQVTRVPNAPSFSTGLINVRGAVVPLTDLRIPLRMPLRETDSDTRILVLDLCLGGAQCVVGMVAEKVHEVTTLESSALEDVPTVGTRWPARFVRAIGRRDDRFFIIPDLDAIFAAYLSGEAPAQAHASKDHIE